MSYGEVHASVDSTVCQHCGWGQSPWYCPRAAGMKAGSTLFRHILSIPVQLGFLSSKQQCPVLRSQSPCHPVPVHCPSPESHSLGRRRASSSRPAAPPCTAPPTRPGDPGSPPTASWPHLLRTPYLRVQPTAPRPRASLPPPQSPTGHGPTRTGRVGLAQPPSSHRELTAVSRLLTPMVSTPGGQVG